ncbi:hypothetical protein CYMTET_9785 [Cymbomonas tetramitiformis]|uniref:Lipoxygenase domain-containing protein n=1 Tax=Cymbomonas tetramitiformis TaxID=36881 RepID=A0AAE0LEI2_9CHLO|nr:hypothetical protein CYMTET_9785 [Cymbomonas tetramitiformis]
MEKALVGCWSMITGARTEGIFSERYKIGVVSGTHRYSGIDAEMTIVIIGKGGRSEPKVLKRPEVGDHKGPHIEVFYINTNEDLEELGAVELFNSGEGLYANWELLKVVVDKVMEGGLVSSSYWQRWVFPAYGWIPHGRSRLFFTGTAFLPSQTPWWLEDQRALALERNRQIYRWNFPEGLPACAKASRMDDLPKDDHLPGWHEKSFKVATASHIVRKGLSLLLGEQRKWTDLDVESKNPGAIFNELYSLDTASADDDMPADSKAKRSRSTGLGSMSEEPAIDIAERLLKPVTAKKDGGCYWEDDVHFGRMLMQGCHPCFLKVCHELPPEFQYAIPLSASMLRHGFSFQDEVEAGRMFVCDYSALKSFLPDPQSGTHGCAPVCYMYLADDPKRLRSNAVHCFLPVAIKLEPDNPEAPIFTPPESADDNIWDWHTAKACVLNADAQYHMIVAYWLKTFACMEPFVLSMHRNLSTMHPIYKLLRPYFRYSLAYNAMARESLTSKGGMFEALFSLGDQSLNLAIAEYQNWKFEDFGLPSSLESRGLTGEEHLPDYPYREDGLLIWAAVVDYVRDYVNLYYHADQDVKQDKELQNWYNDSFKTGHHRLVEEKKLTPEPMISRDLLTKTLVYLIWNSSAQNTILTRGCYDEYGFPAIRPTMLSEAPPKKKNTMTMESFCKMLPSRGDTVSICSFMSWRSERTPLAEPMLGAQMEEHLMEPDALDAYDRFQEALQTVQRVLVSRNDRRPIHYKWMLPTNLTNGVAH